MAINEDTKKLSVRKPFYLATDEGYIHSDHVAVIGSETTAGNASAYHGSKITQLRLNTPRLDDKDNKFRPFVNAPRETVKALFQAHGYSFVEEENLSAFEGKTPEQIADTLGLTRR